MTKRIAAGALILLTAAFGFGRDRVLVWGDEFSGPKGAAPDFAKWAYDIGTGEKGWGNNELEFYSPDQVSLDGKGRLAIRAVKTGPSSWLSARIKSQGKFEMRYGRVEARIRLPQGRGVWPAFWMLGADISSVGWPACGEIDIMESIGREGAVVHSTVHGPGYAGAKGITSAFSPGKAGTFSRRFHIFRADWSPTYIQFYVDGRPFFRVTPAQLPAGANWVFDHPFFLILNLAVGGDWPGNPDGSTVFPQTMLVDWVRVWQTGPVKEAKGATQ